MIGGFLSNPATVIGGPFDTPFWRKYPFFLPCLTAGMIAFSGFLVALFFLEETLGRTVPTPATGSLSPVSTVSGEEVVSETTSLLPKSPAMSPALASPLAPGGSGSVSFLPRESRAATLLLTILAFLTVVGDELYPLWAAANPRVGGLGFEAGDIGLSLAVAAVTILVVQPLFYPRLERRFGKEQLFQWAMGGFAIVWSTLPALHLLLGTRWLWPLLFLSLGFRSACGSFAYASANLMLIDSARRIGALGRVNASAQALASMTRALGPALGGLAWGFSIGGGFPPLVGTYVCWGALGVGGVAAACLMGKWKGRM
jgi:hypothetical protein